MKVTISILLLTTAAFLGCDNLSNKEKTEDSTKYYYGEVTTTSADGNTPYGPVKYSLIKRTINKELKKVTELVKQDGQVFDTELKQIENSNKFSASDKSNSFDGFLTFSGESWNWNKWTYDITMKNNSGKIIGNGFIDSEGIKTEKYFLDSTGMKTVKIIENLKEIEVEKYNELNQK